MKRRLKIAVIALLFAAACSDRDHPDGDGGCRGADVAPETK